MSFHAEEDCLGFAEEARELALNAVVGRALVRITHFELTRFGGDVLSACLPPISGLPPSLRHLAADFP
jgi:hypothetical protein